MAMEDIDGRTSPGQFEMELERGDIDWATRICSLADVLKKTQGMC